MSINGLHHKLAAHPDRQMRFLALDGTLVTKKFSAVHADVERTISELRASGIGAGDKVGILGPNSYAWAVADLALLGLECVSVALPAERGEPVDAAHLCAHYDLSALLFSAPPAAGTELPPEAAVVGERPITLTKRAETGKAHPRLPEEVFSIAFSSGTSGTKKGLLMSRKGVENTIVTSGRAWRIREDDNILIVMPFSNFQQRYLLYTAVWYGCDATVVAPERMFQKLREFEPTIILGPPSFFELVHNRVHAADEKEKLPYHLAAALHALGPDRLTRGIRSRLGRKWTALYGSRVRLMLTGSAPVPPRTVKLFQQLGAPLFEVYGSTEIGWIAFNLPGRHRIGSAGRPVDGIDVTVAEDGEVVVTTAARQALGYVFEGVESQETVFRPDGRVATGDLGRFDAAGFLRLVGRKKNVIITRSGVKINPEELEADLEQNCPIARAIVLSPGQEGLLTCVVWLDDAQAAEPVADVEGYLAQANRQRAASHRITDVVFRPAAELTAESGLLTRNLKVDRNAVVRTILADSKQVGK
ncbi:AMP-binding protein [Streptomyces sp. RS10V-4]|uniref:AMP-binding protein n=1 Tax=Streptomyces rhizoryzae TaxID=2932493 RepID=UPI00200420BC|nr:AMP-binding protein [Streptomyces rhizoryzae]MCK7624968.1 AMP-binding protein [Streptomyces rhizoryzae]